MRPPLILVIFSMLSLAYAKPVDTPCYEMGLPNNLDTELALRMVFYWRLGTTIATRLRCHSIGGTIVQRGIGPLLLVSLDALAVRTVEMYKC